ncbi:ATP-binding protein [Streptomyces durbertensis]|uniref:ATP-binding protein n=1 Tax=Streptomyces durbertensis TaxID=2448886 RepID=A0ABR6EJU3_9ACTN|nr:ATP-binding protein [Streptomyces durbertensis]MBB1245372.1 ATP-binding protein [Streptomyces durbertensis]
MFDRDFEWSELTRFAALPGRTAILGVISGRRRQGKTFLLDALARASGGFMYTATETTEADALRQFGEALARYRGQPTPFRFAYWDEAVTELMRVAEAGKPTVAVIDEFPFLAKASPALPSVIQRALDPTAQHGNTPVRLLLCGSALSFMGGLLSGSAPLRGRAGLELVVPTLDFRLAGEFWQISDPRTALLVNAIVGGTPAYRREYTQGDTPSGPDDFDAWVTRAVLNPARPLFREARYLLAEEPELHDTALYHSVLAAIAAGNTARGGIADYLGRRSTDLAHPLTVLQDVGMITHEGDAFRRNRSAYRIAEPLVTFYHAVMRPSWGDLERPGRAAAVWRRSASTFRSKVVGPHFEQVCREWARWHAAPDTHGGLVTSVASGVVNDPSARTSHEVDVAVHGERDDGRKALLAIGEAKWSDVMGLGHLERLRRIRGLLIAAGTATEATRLQCYSGAGFTGDLRELAERDGTVQLVDLPRLYHGD